MIMEESASLRKRCSTLDCNHYTFTLGQSFAWIEGEMITAKFGSNRFCFNISLQHQRAGVTPPSCAVLLGPFLRLSLRSQTFLNESSAALSFRAMWIQNSGAAFGREDVRGRALSSNEPDTIRETTQGKAAQKHMEVSSSSDDLSETTESQDQNHRVPKPQSPKTTESQNHRDPRPQRQKTTESQNYRVPRPQRQKTTESQDHRDPRPQRPKTTETQDHRVPRPQRPKTTETQDHRDPRPQRPKTTESQDHRDPKPQSPKTTESQDHRVPRPQSPKTTETQNHRVPRPQRPKTTESQDHRVPRPQSPKTTESQEHRVPRPQSPKSTVLRQDYRVPRQD
ncbi:hypothetical protein WMY93_009187 [Mugilogobius chulae]|uniref:Uncharacterized protein n=1 Tax=Mugilogobius chulae TaxID=88201 RepID=A0AAW0PEP6_9GOBI